MSNTISRCQQKKVVYFTVHNTCQSVGCYKCVTNNNRTPYNDEPCVTYTAIIEKNHLCSVPLWIYNCSTDHLHIFSDHLLHQIIESGCCRPSKLLLCLGRISQ